MEEYFKRMHEYMDKGWKTTFSNCDEPKCNGALLLANIAEKKTFCPKCKAEKAAEFEVNKNPGYDEFEEDDEDDGQQDYDKLASKLMQDKKPPLTDADRKKKQDDDDHKSKKMGEYLLAGYTMLQTHCDDCQVPHFRDFSKVTFCPNCMKRVEAKPATDVSLQPRPEAHKAPVQSLPNTVSSQNKLAVSNPLTSGLQQAKAAAPLQSKIEQPQISQEFLLGENMPVRESPIRTPKPQQPVASSQVVRDEIESIRLGCIYQAVQEIYQKQGLNFQDKSLLINEFLKKANYFTN